MSNHSGSYMLNDVLFLLKQYGIFDVLDKKSHSKLVKQIVKIGDHYDCNPGEILDEIGYEFGICYYCVEEKSEISYDGLCRDCREDFDEEDLEDS